MAKINPNEICIPQIVNRVLSFDTRFFLLAGDVAEIVETQANPHVLFFRWKNVKYMRTAQQLKETLKLTI